MDVGIRYGDGRWPDLESTFLLRDEGANKIKHEQK
jgi:hypothetical protein